MRTLSSFVRFSVNMAVSWMGFVSFFCVIFARSGFSLYFHMGETEKKCFIEEIPDETMVTGALYFFFLQQSRVRVALSGNTRIVL